MLNRGNFEEEYIAVRKKEQRLYTDAEVSSLPKISRAHVHFKEWKTRERSAKRLIKYLSRKQMAPGILEIGCGNGWLSARLAEIKNAQVLAVDINKEEIGQAGRVFAGVSNLTFKIADISQNEITRGKFDIIVFAASIQYFPSFKKVITAALSLLEENGEIHIIDSFFYHVNDTASAAIRSLDYYQKLGHPEMAGNYFQHSQESMIEFHYHYFFNPARRLNRILRRSVPFPWIVIKA